MKTLRYAVLAVALFAAVAGRAQQGPTLVWEREITGQIFSTTEWIVRLPNGMLVVNGQYGGGAGLAGFSSDGRQLWVVQDSLYTSAWSGQLATLPADTAVVWVVSHYQSSRTLWLVKTGTDGRTIWRIPSPIPDVITYIGDYTTESFIAVMNGNFTSSLLVINRDGVVTKQFQLPEPTGPVVTIRARGDSVLLGYHIYSGIAYPTSYVLALFRISSGERVWRTVFPDIVRGFFDNIGESGNSFVCGTKVDTVLGWKLKFLRAKVSLGGTVEWSHEHLTKRTRRANNANWTNNVVIVYSGSSEQAVLVGAIERDDTGSTAGQMAYAMGFKTSTGDSLWHIIAHPDSSSGTNFFGAVRDGPSSWVMVRNSVYPYNRYDGIFKFLAPTLLVKELPGIPESFKLSQNYPNPFNPSTAIRFELVSRSPVVLTVHDVLGREITILVNETLESGVYETKWDAAEVASGVYFYRLQTDRFTETRKMILLR